MSWSIFDEIADLDAERSGKLRSVCAEFGLLPESTDRVVEAARLLMDFHRHGKSKILTPAAKRKRFNKLAQMAADLAAELKLLELHERARLSEGMDLYVINLGIMRGPPAVPTGAKISALQWDMERLSFSASSVANGAKTGANSGRKKTSWGYFAGLERLADAVVVHGFTLTRGGRFEELSKAAFEAAEVYTGVAGAIRTFLEGRADQIVFHAEYLARFRK